MPPARKIAVIVPPLLIFAASFAFLILARDEDPPVLAVWVAIGSFVLAALTLVVAWLTWVRPMSSAKSSSEAPTAPHTIKADRSSIGFAGRDASIIRGADGGTPKKGPK